MTVTKESYRKMNKAYNTIFDEWQAIEDMEDDLYAKMNTALVLLDGVLDAIKKDATDATEPAWKASGLSLG